MRIFGSFLATGLLLLQSLSSASPLACPDSIDCSFTRADVSPAQVARELGRKLSRAALIYGPGDPRYTEAIARYQQYNPPNIQIVVQPGTEEDVAEIVKYANKNSIAFLTVNRGHSLISTLNRFRGLQIDMASLRAITINSGGKTAWLQGGAYGQEVIDTLWARGYVATTGSCACVGILGPGLGGGYGRYQGLHGLVSDNFVTLRVVLADGTRTTVSQRSNPELFWAMKGAGHNFGIVTSVELQIHPRNLSTWYYKNYFWTGDKLERVIEQVNRLSNNGTGPVQMALQSGTYLMDPTISTTEAVIAWSFGWSGAQRDAARYLAPFDAIPAVRVQDGNIPYTQIPQAQGSGVDDLLCATGFSHQQGHAGLWQWNAKTQRAIYDLFNRNIQARPAFNTSLVLLEAYALQGVKAVNPSTSSFPWRNAFNVMGVISVNYRPDPSLDAAAFRWRTQTRDLWRADQPGTKPLTYVNYAYGDESLESIYGDSLPRLRRLKAKYDPHGRFSYYNAIPAGK
ncbi:FAD binding domain-containing protein [Colletotrichum plurivorum]|uniref:FAD binding domain-containing protein n=1 Tax=Colletotrichum plurivorum TaxID=2175906 RepID=A0A8H6KDQ6_9PEZI|nr:FAD binding domain-containing protein [Colletotrichum plurivorum]